jgi:hypothetical protein
VKIRTAILAISHVALAAAGFALHQAYTPAPVAATPPPVEKPSLSRLDSATAHAVPVSNNPADSPWSATDCRKAWHALKGSHLPPRELAILRRQIMELWLHKDLRSALITWTDEETLGPSPKYSLDYAIRGHEAELLDWILAGDFGLDGKSLLNEWAKQVSTNPDALIAALPRLPDDCKEGVLLTLFPMNLKGEELDRRIAKIADLPTEAEREKAWGRVLDGVRDNTRFNRAEDRFHELLYRDDVPPAAHRTAVEGYAARLTDETEPPKALEAFRKLTPEDQQTVGPKLLERAAANPFLSSTITNALTMLVESNQWELIEEKGAQALDDSFQNLKPDSEEITRWAMQLPPRDETAAIFRHAVAGRFRDDLNAGAEWAHSLQDGWYRDQALAQLAIAADLTAGHAKLRDEALGEIKDANLRQEIEASRTK